MDYWKRGKKIEATLNAPASGLGWADGRLLHRVRLTLFRPSPIFQLKWGSAATRYKGIFGLPWHGDSHEHETITWRRCVGWIVDVRGCSTGRQAGSQAPGVEMGERRPSGRLMGKGRGGRGGRRSVGFDGSGRGTDGKQSFHVWPEWDRSCRLTHWHVVDD